MDLARREREVADALAAAACLAVAPHALGGVRLDVGSPAAGEAWLAALRALLPVDIPLRRVPSTTSEDRLLGGLDLAATLAHGRARAERGVLAESDGGVVALTGAERAPATLGAHLAQVLDTGMVQLERDGLRGRHDARVGIVAVGERGDDETAAVPAALAERMAIALRLDAATPAPDVTLVRQVARARERVHAVRVDDAGMEALCEAALALGTGSVRGPLLAMRVARVSAALAGRDAVTDEDLALAARLVLAPRATRLPDEPTPPPPAEPSPPPPDEGEREGDDDGASHPRDVVLDAARAALPPHVLAALVATGSARGEEGRGRAGGQRTEALRGRAIGSRPGMPRGGRRLHVLETLRAAAPWQRVRAASDARTRGDGGLRVTRDDLRIRRHVAPRTTTTIVAVDASGSQALDRLAEAKGCVELLLADSYRRRDKVALLAFRGTGAELLLPPTRALARAKRVLAALPGGGGTPLASALDACAMLAERVSREGGAPLVVLITDGRANVARDGTGGRPQAEADAREAAVRLARVLRGGTSAPAALVVDTSRRGEPFAATIAATLGARYVLLPSAEARGVASAAAAMRDGVGDG